MFCNIWTQHPTLILIFLCAFIFTKRKQNKNQSKVPGKTSGMYTNRITPWGCYLTSSMMWVNCFFHKWKVQKPFNCNWPFALARPKGSNSWLEPIIDCLQKGASLFSNWQVHCSLIDNFERIHHLPWQIAIDLKHFGTLSSMKILAHAENNRNGK